MTVTARDVARAAQVLRGTAFETPVWSSPAIDRLVGRRVLLKAENQQRTGSFKFRGAYYAVHGLKAERRSPRGVIGASSGNHARALATVSRLLGVRATVVIPSDAPHVKRRAAISLGADVVTYDREAEDRDAKVALLARARGLAVVPSSDSAMVVAGAGTAAWELGRHAPDLAALFVPLGGGGLAAGSAIAAHAINRHTKVIGVEPALADDTLRSLAAGQRVSIRAPATIADGLRHTQPARLPFEINQRLLHDVVTVSEEDIADAMGLLFLHYRTVAEPSGSVAFAGLLTGGVRIPRGPIGVLLTGGNVDWPLYRSLLDPAMKRTEPRLGLPDVRPRRPPLRSAPTP